MHDILDADELRETEAYISELPDNTNGKELTEYAAKLCREINEERSENYGKRTAEGKRKTESASDTAFAPNVGRSSCGHGSRLCCDDA